MPLATQEQIQEALSELIVRHNLTVEHRLILTDLGSMGRLMYREKAIFQWDAWDRLGPWPGEFSIHNEAKYKQITNGKTLKDLTKDLFYHWITDFKHLNTFDKLRAAILEPETCGSMATTIAVNKWIIRTEPEQSQIKPLLAGSKFRWGLTTEGDYVQQTLYNQHNYTSRAIDFVFLEQGMYGSNIALTSLPTINHWLNRKIQSINDIIEAQALRHTTELQQHSAKATSTFSFKFNSKTKDTAPPLFPDIKPPHLFLGIELELEGLSPKEFQNLNILKQHAIFKRDGSLNNGVEICSAPATIDIHKQEFEPFFQSLIDKKSKLEAKPNCGVHIHIDRAKLSTLHIATLYQLVNKPENRPQLTALSGRQPNTYCQAHETGYNHFTQKEEDQKYRMLNLKPTDTIELRIFASTTKYPVFCRYLELAQALVDYTKPGFLGIPISKLPLWEHFKSYVVKHPKSYPTLAKEI